MILLNADGVPKCVCSIEFELMYDGRTCGKPSAHFVSLQMVSQSRASLGIPTKFDLLDILNVTDPPTTADLDQRGKIYDVRLFIVRLGYIRQVSLTESVSETVVDEPSLSGQIVFEAVLKFVTTVEGIGEH